MKKRKTKIICTIGPASGTETVIRELILNGMNVARLNFSHGSHEEHKEKIRLIRKISEELHNPVAILQDLCGPKIRVGEIPGDGIVLVPGETFILTNEDVDATDNMVSVSYHHLPEEVSKEDRILLADGMLELVVDKITEARIYCTVITGGMLTSRKGINLPSGSTRISAVTQKDLDDLAFGLEEKVDFVALSFVRDAGDILKIKDVIKKKKESTPVIAKIEKHEAIKNIDEIIEASDGVMVARGDLGVEISLEQVPRIQKMLIKKSNLAGKPVIIATQMLRSMVDSPRPTRAEATDVANAVLDGTDAIMLSEETATGQFPVEAVQFMQRIAMNAEEDFPFDQYIKRPPHPDISESVAYASCVLADHLNAAAIIAATKSGFTAMQLCKFRPKSKILAISPDPNTVKMLNLFWGCVPTFQDKKQSTDEMVEMAAKTALDSGYVQKGDKVIITAGHPLWVKGTTNMIQVKTI